MKRDLTPLLFPESVAVVGASPRPESLAGAVVRNLIAGGFPGKLAAVHPKATWEGNLTTARSTEDLPFVPDLVVWGVTADIIQHELPKLLDQGARGHIVLTAGFSESGKDGSAKEKTIVQMVRDKNGVMVGPNCMGLHVARPHQRLDASFCRVRPEPGPAAIFVQSGSVGEWLLVGMAARQLGAAIKVSLGNMGDLDVVDFIEAVPRYLPEVRQIFLYLETMPEAARLRVAIANLPPGVNVIALHGGRSDVGARAVMGHTGALAEEPALVDALLRNAGIQPVASLMEALDSLEVLQRLETSRGRRASVVTNAGGPGILVADALIEAGFTVPEPSAELTHTLRGMVAPAASLANPIDLIASATPAIFESSLNAIAASPEYDVIVPVFMHPITVDAGDIAAAMKNGIGPRSKHTVICWMPGAQSFAARDELRAEGFAVIEEPSRVGRALGIWASLGSARRSTARSTSALPQIEDRRLFGQTWGDPEALELFLAGSLHAAPPSLRAPSPPSRLEGLTFPLYVKIETPDAPHKAKAGLLSRVESPADLVAAVARLWPPAKGRWLFQQAVRRGPEIYVGFLRHPRLGAFVGFGPGGATPDPDAISWIALPAPPEDIETAIRKSRAVMWLGDAAGQALTSLVTAMASLEERGPMIKMAEVNPAIWDVETGRFWMVDVRWQAGTGEETGAGL